MSHNFLRFKRKFSRVRILKSVLAALSAGFISGGVCNILSRLAIAGFAPWISIPIGVGAAVAVGVAICLLLGKSDATLARELDTAFSLNEKVETMVEFEDERGILFELQRRDADETLAGIATKRYKAKRLWIYAVLLSLSVAAALCSFLAPNLRDYVPEEEVEPFELSPLQEAGVGELISYVDSSDMEEPYRTEVSAELRKLVPRLKEIHTVPEMKLVLAETMERISVITSDSSSATEILNSLWDNGSVYLKHLAKTLDTEGWSSSDWGDFAEKMNKYITVLYGEEAEDAPTDEQTLKSNLKWAIDTVARNVDISLGASRIPEDDALYAVLHGLMNGEGETEGFAALAAAMDGLTYEEAKAAVRECLDGSSDDIFGAVSTLKTNTNVGEYAMTKLGTLFLVPVPEFERPEFVKNRETIDDGKGGGESEDDDKAPTDGGIGEGATFGSKDLVLDPLTGNYVEYGTLIDKYHALMYEKLDSGEYTEEQKTAIKNYFTRLYGGLEKEEDN